MALISQQSIEGRITIGYDEKGRPITRRKQVIIALDEETGDTHVLPWDQKNKQPIISIDTLRTLHPDLAKTVKNSLRRAPAHQVKR